MKNELPKLAVQPDPRYAGPQHHPLHQARYITTADCVLEVDMDRFEESETIIATSGSIIAEMTDCEDQKRLATLFASAPELLEALQAFDVWLITPGPLDTGTIVAMRQKARTAIARATGEAEP